METAGGPLHPAATVSYRIGDDGRVAGSGTLHLEGRAAWVRLGWKGTDEATVTAWTRKLQDEFGGFTVSDVAVEIDDGGWKPSPAGRVPGPRWGDCKDTAHPPTARLDATISLPRFVRGRPGHRWLRLPRLASLPSLSVMKERSIHVALHPGTTSLRPVRSLPSGWCPPREFDGRAETPLGSHLFEVRAAKGGTGLTAEHTTIATSARALPPEPADLETLIRAREHAAAARVRLRCTRRVQGATRKATPSGG